MPGIMLPERMRQLEPSGASEGPPPGFLETMGAGFRTAKDDVATVQNNRLEEAYLPMIRALTEANGKAAGDYRPWTGKAGFALNPFGQTMDLWDIDAVWADVEKARKANPSALSGIPKSREEFEKQVLTRDGARAADQRTVSRGNGVASFVGALGAMPFDPVNIATAPIGGGAKSIGQAILREAVINAGVEAVQQVPLASARRRMGEELTLSEAATNVTVAGVFGGLLGGASKYGADNWDSIKAAPKAVQEKVWASILDKVPALQKSMAGKMDWDALDDSLPDLAEAIIGVENLSVDEKGVIGAMRREAQIEAMNPFGVDGAGIAAHRGELAKALQRVMDDAPVTPIKARKVPAAGGFNAGTALSGNVVPVPPGAGWSRVATDVANATGLTPTDVAAVMSYETRGTFSPTVMGGKGGRYMGLIQFGPAERKLYGITSLSSPEDWSRAIIGFMRDRGFKKGMGILDFYSTINAGRPGKYNASDGPGNTVRGHVEKILSQHRGNAAKWLSKGGVVDNSAPGRIFGAADEGAGAIDPEAGVRDWIEQERAAVDAELARIDAEEVAAPDTRSIVDEALADKPEPIAAARIEPLAQKQGWYSDTAPPQVQAMLPDIRRIVADREAGGSLSDLRRLSRQMGVNEEDLRTGMMTLAANREIRMRYNKDGTALFSRLPRDAGPVDIRTFVARNGGLAVDGLNDASRKAGGKGHALGAGGRDWHKGIVPGAGPLLRKTGHSLDEMGEKLWEAGYFRDRPTEDQVLQAIENSVQGRAKLYPFGQEARPGKAMLDHLEDIDRHYMRQDFDRAAEDMGFDPLDDADFEMAVETLMDFNDAMRGDLPLEQAVLLEMVNRRTEALQRALFEELKDDIYAGYEEQFAKAWAEYGVPENGWPDGPDSIGRTPGSGDAGRGGEAGADARGNGQAPQAIELEPDDFKPFDDPAEGSGASTQIQSMDHDLRALAAREDDMFGGATQAEKRQALERKGDGGLDNGKEQKPVGGDGGLFDPASWDQMDFRMDAEGDVVNPADLLAEFDAEDAVLKTIKDCL